MECHAGWAFCFCLLIVRYCSLACFFSIFVYFKENAEETMFRQTNVGEVKVRITQTVHRFVCVLCWLHKMLICSEENIHKMLISERKKPAVKCDCKCWITCMCPLRTIWWVCFYQYICLLKVNKMTLSVCWSPWFRSELNATVKSWLSELTSCLAGFPIGRHASLTGNSTSLQLACMDIIVVVRLPTWLIGNV